MADGAVLEQRIATSVAFSFAPGSNGQPRVATASFTAVAEGYAAAVAYQVMIAVHLTA